MTHLYDTGIEVHLDSCSRTASVPLADYEDYTRQYLIDSHVRLAIWIRHQGTDLLGISKLKGFHHRYSRFGSLHGVYLRHSCDDFD